MGEMRDIKRWNDLRFESLNDEDDFIVEIISSIVNRRIQLGLSQRDLAEISGVKQSAIARLEKCKAVPQIDTLYKLTKPLKLKFKLVAIAE